MLAPEASRGKPRRPAGAGRSISRRAANSRSQDPSDGKACLTPPSRGNLGPTDRTRVAVPRHHLVPQSLLRRFADERERLVMVPRLGGEPKRTSVATACAETGFYAIEVADEYVDQADSEYVETLLSQVEDKAKRHLDAILDGCFPLSDQTKFDLALFLALQVARGWVFRNDLVEIATHAARMHTATISEDRVREWLRERGEPTDAQSIRENLRGVRAMEGMRVVPSNGEAVRQMLQYAIDGVHPHLYFRNWRLLRFDSPCLLISDEPVALWGRPTRDLDQHPLGVATADAVWFPIDRCHALALLQSGEEKISDASAIRTRQLNVAVAAGAHRWIFHHPADAPLAGLEIPAPAKFVDEVRRVEETAYQIREQHWLVKR